MRIAPLELEYMLSVFYSKSMSLDAAERQACEVELLRVRFLTFSSVSVQAVMAFQLMRESWMTGCVHAARPTLPLW